MKKHLNLFRTTPRHKLQSVPFLFMIVAMTFILSAAVTLLQSSVDPTLCETDPYRLCVLVASRKSTLSALWLCLCEAIGGGLLLDYARKCENPLLD